MYTKYLLYAKYLIIQIFIPFLFVYLKRFPSDIQEQREIKNHYY